MLCPQRYFEVEFPLVKSAGAENVLLALVHGKGFARGSGGMCPSPPLAPAPPDCWHACCSGGAGKVHLRCHVPPDHSPQQGSK